MAERSKQANKPARCPCPQQRKRSRLRERSTNPCPTPQGRCPQGRCPQGRCPELLDRLRNPVKIPSRLHPNMATLAAGHGPRLRFSFRIHENLPTGIRHAEPQISTIGAVSRWSLGDRSELAQLTLLPNFA